MEFLYTKVVKNGLITNKMPSREASKSKQKEEEIKEEVNTFDDLKNVVEKQNDTIKAQKTEIEITLRGARREHKTLVGITPRRRPRSVHACRGSANRTQTQTHKNSVGGGAPLAHPAPPPAAKSTKNRS